MQSTLCLYHTLSAMNICHYCSLSQLYTSFTLILVGCNIFIFTSAHFSTRRSGPHSRQKRVILDSLGESQSFFSLDMELMAEIWYTKCLNTLCVSTEKKFYESILIHKTCFEGKIQQHKSSRGKSARALQMQDWGMEQVALYRRVRHWEVEQTYIGELDRPECWLARELIVEIGVRSWRG